MDIKKDINYRFWHEYYPLIKNKFIGELPKEVKDFHNSETKEMIKLISIGKKYLFVGCGDGREIEPIKEKKDVQIFGLDFVPQAVDEFQQKFKKNPNIIKKLGSAQDMPFKDDFFDGVFLLYNNLSVVGNQIEMLKEIKRILKSGGFLFGTVYNENAKDLQIKSYKGLDMTYLKHDNISVTVISPNRITYTSERFSKERLKKLFSSINLDIEISNLTRYSYKYKVIKN